MDRTDAQISTDIVMALATDRATESYEIDVAVNDGVVTLTGTVESFAEKELAAKVAKGVRGVTGLTNDIDIDYEVERSDAEIKADIEKTLQWDTLVDDGLIDVQVDNGQVRLTGTVGSAAEKRQARYDAWVAGVESVNVEGLDVDRWARDEELRKDKYVAKSADEIKDAVKDALLFDPRVSSFDVSVDVVGSTVTLRGTVPYFRTNHCGMREIPVEK